MPSYRICRANTSTRRLMAVRGGARPMLRSTMAIRIDYQTAGATDALRSDVPAARAADSRRRAAGDRTNRLAGRVTMPSDPTHPHHTPDEERKIREAALDQTIEGSFPASDPPSSNPNPDDDSALERRSRIVEDQRKAPDQSK